MQDEIIPPFCRFDSAKVLTDTVSVSTRGNVTVILSATLWTISPFALVCAIWPLARTRTSKCRSDWWRSKCPAPAEGGSRLQTRSLVQRGGNFFRDVAKIRIAFCISDFQRRILRSWTVTAVWSAKCAPRQASSSVSLTLELCSWWHHPLP